MLVRVSMIYAFIEVRPEMIVVSLLNRCFCSSRIQQTELLPEETLLSQITQDDWLDMLDDDGQVEDEMLLRKVRCNAWIIKVLALRSPHT